MNKKIELNDIKNPKILKDLDGSNIDRLVEDARELIIKTCLINGGHHGANTSILETTVGLLRAFNVEDKDILVYDIGHNCYPYKIFTDRADKFHTLRNLNGIKGFQDIFESKYDHINQGNGGTCLSNALGMAATDVKKERNIVTVIGDSIFGNGTVYEFFNHAKYVDHPMIIVVNDNAASIGPVIGNLQGWKNDENTTFKTKLPIWASLFDFEYLGPIDGHDWRAVEKLSIKAKQISKSGKSVIMHVLTEKGRGLNYKKPNNGGYLTHAIGRPLNHVKWATKIWPIIQNEMIKNDKIDVIASGMLYPLGFNNIFSNKDIKNVDNDDAHIQRRIYNVGIAEGHAASFAAGLALSGRIPLIAYQSAFLRRSLDHILHDIAITKQYCVIQIEEIGTIENGNTHHGFYDLPMMNMIPTTRILTPSNIDEMKYAYKAAFLAKEGIWVVRSEKYIENYQEKLSTDTSSWSLTQPKWFITNSKTDKVLVISYGQMFAKIRDIVEKNNLDLTIANALWQKPLDENFVKTMIEKYDRIILVEDTVVGNGLDVILANYVDTTKIEKWMYPKDYNLTFGEEESVRRLFELDYESIEKKLKNI